MEDEQFVVATDEQDEPVLRTLATMSSNELAAAIDRLSARVDARRPGAPAKLRRLLRAGGMPFTLEGHAVSDLWDPDVCRECAEVWVQKAEILPAGEQRTTYLALATGYASLSALIEAESCEIMPAREA
jgi:hypothetical protein